MFEEGFIIYFDPFYFKNGNTAKPKYFVVLKILDGENIIASLPTRTDSIPQKEEIESGCLELPDINLNCYVIPPDTGVTECGKQFISKTYIYGHQIDMYSIELLEEIYPIEGADYHVWGKMRKIVFDSLMECLKNSKSVKRKYKNIFNS